MLDMTGRCVTEPVKCEVHLNDLWFWDKERLQMLDDVHQQLKSFKSFEILHLRGHAMGEETGTIA